MKSDYKKEKTIHNSLLKMLKKHFREDEDEMLDDEKEDEDGRFVQFEFDLSGPNRRKDGDDPDKEYDDEDEPYDSEGADDGYYNDLMDSDEDDMMEDEEEDDEDENGKLGKEKRKKMAMVVLAKKAGRGKL